MTALARPLIVLTAVLALPGCAAVHELDRLADQAEVRSNCLTSTGDWVGGPSCEIEWSASKTTSTTTTTVITTTTSAPASPPADD